MTAPGRWPAPQPACAYAAHAAGLTLIDTGVVGSAPLIGKAIEELGYYRSDVQRLSLTHCHEDNIGSAADIAGRATSSSTQTTPAHQMIRGEMTVPPPQPRRLGADPA
jgi:glyoxylase-like metal-dependent hydrolase (beta-lactamase superfamily II)